MSVDAKLRLADFSCRYNARSYVMASLASYLEVVQYAA